MAARGGNFYITSGREINLNNTEKFSSCYTEQRESLGDIVAITGYVLDKGGIVIRFSGGARYVYCSKGLYEL
jgi:hypothetical protein